MVELPCVATFGLLQYSLKFPQYNVLLSPFWYYLNYIDSQMFPRVAARQPRELVEVLVFQLSPVYHMQLRSRDVAAQSLGCSLNIPF